MPQAGIRGSATGVGSRRPSQAPVEPGILPALQAPRSLAEDAADLIRQQILSGGFRRGEHLVEARIARQLNVSRGPVREAFKLLRSEGLLDEEPRRGTFVVTLSAADVREIYDLRAAVEGRAARLLARDPRPAAVAELRSAIDAMDAAATAGDVQAVGRHDLEFHEGLCRLSGNRRLHAVFLQHVRALRTLIRLDEQLYRSPAEIAPQHRPILDAIEAGDSDLAAARCEAHCEEARELIATYLEGLGDR